MKEEDGKIEFDNPSIFARMKYVYKSVDLPIRRLTKSDDLEECNYISHMPSFGTDDKTFSAQCDVGMKKCLKMHKKLKYASIISKLIQGILITVIIPTYSEFKISIIIISSLVAFVVALLILDVLCSWQNQQEKYGNLYLKFRNLKLNRDAFERDNLYNEYIQEFEIPFISSDEIHRCQE